MNLNRILKELNLSKLPCPIIFSSQNLRFFEAGAFVQEGSFFWIELNKRSYLSCFGYDLETILKHELIHALRKDFPDSIWEEVVAYQVSKFSYQKVLGPFLSLKRGKFGLVAFTLLFSFSNLLDNPLFMILGMSLFLISFMSYFPYYYKLIKIKKKLIEEGKDPLTTLIQRSPDEFNLKISDF